MDTDEEMRTMEEELSTTYRVSGMTCEGCTNAVTNAIMAVAPGATVKVSLDDKSVTVEGFDDAAAIATAVDDAGFEFGGATA